MEKENKKKLEMCIAAYGLDRWYGKTQGAPCIELAFQPCVDSRIEISGTSLWELAPSGRNLGGFIKHHFDKFTISSVDAAYIKLKSLKHASENLSLY